MPASLDDGPDTALALALLASGALDAQTLRRALDEVRAARGGPDEVSLGAWLLDRRVLGPDALAAATSGAAAPRPAASPPERLGAYRVVRLLGQGGMGAVHEVEHVETGVRYALKTLAALADDEARARFRREVEALGRLRHPAVVAVHTAELDGGKPYVVQELVAGGSLADRLRDRGPLPVDEVVALGAALARGLAHAHAAGVLHRDLKPANVLLAERGPCLADFGLARLAGRESLTRTGEALGTPAYMAPEQIVEPSRVGPAADVYGLGATLHAALTGRAPFEGASVWNVLDKALRASPPSTRALRPEVPAALDALVLECLAKAPAARPPTAAALADRLEALRQRAASPAAPPATRACAGLVAGLAALGLALVVAAAAWRASTARGPVEPTEPVAATASTSSAATPAAPATTRPPPHAAAAPLKAELVLVDGDQLGEWAEVQCAWLARRELHGLRARGSFARHTGPGASFVVPAGALEVEAELDLLLLDEPLSLDLLLAADSTDAGIAAPVGFGARLTTASGGAHQVRGELIGYVNVPGEKAGSASRERRREGQWTLRLRYLPEARRGEVEWTLDGESLGKRTIEVGGSPGTRWRLVTRVAGTVETPSTPLPVCDVLWRRLVVRGSSLAPSPEDEANGPGRAAARAVAGRAPPGWADRLAPQLEDLVRTAAAAAAERGDEAAAVRLFGRLWDGCPNPSAQLTPQLTAELGLYSPAARRALALAWREYWTRKDGFERDDKYLVKIALRDDAPEKRARVAPGHVLFHLAAASDLAQLRAPLAYARALLERGDPAEARRALTRAHEAMITLDDTEGLAFDVAYRLDRFAEAVACPAPREPTDEFLVRQARARTLSRER